MGFSEVFSELSSLSEDIKKVVDSFKAQSQFKFNDKDEPKKQILQSLLILLQKETKDFENNRKVIKNLSDEDKKKLMQFFGYDILIKAMSDINLDREELLLPELLGVGYDIGNFCEKTIIEERKDVKSSYFGSFEKGVPNGQGIISYYKCGEKIGFYQGVMKDGLPEGEGKISMTIDGVTFYYQGNFEKGLPHGEGAMIIDGDEYKGNWQNGCLNHNDCEIVFKNGVLPSILNNKKVDSKAKDTEEASNTEYRPYLVSLCNFFSFLNPLNLCQIKECKAVEEIQIKDPERNLPPL